MESETLVSYMFIVQGRVGSRIAVRTYSVHGSHIVIREAYHHGKSSSPLERSAEMRRRHGAHGLIQCTPPPSDAWT